jgi:cephalosporin-C deacetylase-like acetyl esterase
MDAKVWLAATVALFCMVEAGSGADKASATGPWNLKQLQRAPKHEIAETQEVREKGAEGEVAVRLSSLYYEGEPWLGKPTRVFAYYARPAVPSGKKLPAIVLVHGGGGTAFPQWARLWAARGYAALAMDLSGCGPERKRLEDGGPDQGDEWKFRRLKDGVENAWSYHAVAAVIRGVSFLRTLPEVDRERIGITGISWGGYLTCIAMSLDDRLKAAIPVYGCGFLHENSAWVSVLSQLPEAERKTWIENFDPSRYLPRCKIPVLWVNGTNDFAYPLDSYQKSYRAMKGPRTLCVTVKMPHGHEAGWAPQEVHLFTNSILGKDDFAQGLARVGLPVIRENKAYAPYASDSAMQKAQIHWTTDLEKPWAEREWQSATGDVLGLDAVSAPLPEKRPVVFFLTLTDLRGAVTSSEHATLE